MKTSLASASSNLLHQVATIKRAIMAVVAIASEGGEGRTRLEEGLSPLTRSQAGGGHSKGEESRQSMVVGSKPQSVSVHSARAPTTAGSSQEGGRRGGGEEWGEGCVVGEAGEEVLGHVSGLVFSAVCEMVSRSHCQLCRGLWGEGEQGQVGGGGEESASLRGAGDMSRSFVDLSEQRTLSLLSMRPVDNPRAVLEDFSQRFRSHSSIPRVQLEAKIQFSIPRIHMEPRLSDIHSEVAQVTSVLLSVLHKLSWWAGPDAGRTFYSVYDASGAADHMQGQVLEAFRGGGSAQLTQTTSHSLPPPFTLLLLLISFVPPFSPSSLAPLTSSLPQLLSRMWSTASPPCGSTTSSGGRTGMPRMRSSWRPAPATATAA